jgi:arylformamidase
MRHTGFMARSAVVLAMLAMLGTAPAQGQLFLMMRMAKRLNKPDTPAKSNLPATSTLSYGPASEQALDLWLPKRDAGGAATPAPVPLVLFVHGGGWSRGSKDSATGSFKAPHFTQAGYAFASINYRLVPGVRVEDEAADVAAALARVLADADKLGIDRRRVVLIGHSAGAHLVALVGTNEAYLRGAGLRFADVAGIIPLDGAAYDVPRQMHDGGPMMQRMYDQAFGKDPARQAALSPALQAIAAAGPAFLVLHVQRPDGIAQSTALAEALRKAGRPVERADFPGTGLAGHMEINRSLGDPAYAGTKAVDAWLKKLFA